MVVDTSGSGLLICAEKTITPNSMVRIEITEGKIEFKAEATVVRVAQDEDIYMLRMSRKQVEIPAREHTFRLPANKLLATLHPRIVSILFFVEGLDHPVVDLIIPLLQVGVTQKHVPVALDQLFKLHKICPAIDDPD